ncbi:MAG: hypothetical protein GXO43_05825 [Crenarchaeota archaeon]|nr:hypothetical protein [Thermoproteota archaeon]
MIQRAPKALYGIVYGELKGLVLGFFGGGKTKHTLSLVKKAVEKERPRVLYIYAAPLRKLRDFVADVWMNELIGMDKVFIQHAHDEVCEALQKRLKETSEYKNLSYHVALQQHIESGEPCHYRKHVASLKNYVELRDDTRLVVSTHTLSLFTALLAMGSKMRYTIIFDEAEDYLETLSHAIPVEEALLLKKEYPEVYERLKRFYIRVNHYLYPRPDTLRLYMNSILISATLPRTLYSVMETIYGSIPYVRLKPRSVQDTVILYNKIIPSTHAQDYTGLTLDLVEKAVEEYGAVGIVAKNKNHAQHLYERLVEVGFKVSSETHDHLPSPHANVYILVPKGKWYRGVSIINKNLGRDIPVVIAFYQGGMPQDINPGILMMMGNVDADAVSKYYMEQRDAANLQSLYRYNRMRTQKHIMVLLDRRWIHPYNRYHPSVWKKMRKHVARSTGEVVRLFAGASAW